MTLPISRSQPAYTNDLNAYPPSRAVDNLYGTTWVSPTNPSVSTPVWLAIDLSAVPSGQRQNVTFYWFNEQAAYWMSPDLVIFNYYSLPQDYTIEANTAAGGGAAPTTGWQVLKTVTGNNYSSRAHRINLSGYNWVRINCTKNLDTSGTGGLSFQVDVFSTPYDDFLSLGDSITEEAMGKHNIDGSEWNNGPIPVQVNASAPSHFPVMIDGGTPTMTMAWAATNIASLLAPFEGAYVSVAYGTNDLNQNFAMSNAQIQAVYANLLTIVQAIHNAQKVPIVPKVPYGSANSGNLGVNALALNNYVDAHLSVDAPYAVRGADLYTPFQQNPALLRDGIHPTYAGANSGYDLYHTTWTSWLVGAYPTLPSPPTPQYQPSILFAFSGAKTRVVASFVRNPTVAQQNSTVDSAATLSHSDGTPIVISTISVTVTFPDASTTIYTLAGGQVVNTSGTVYTLTYTTKGVGTHIEDWTITDSNGAVGKYRIYTSSVQ